LVNGVRIDPTSRSLLPRQIETMLQSGRSHVVHFVSADPTVLGRRDHSYREILNRGDLNLADGKSVVWALRLLGLRTERMPGSDTMELLVGWGAPRGIRHYLFGGAPNVVADLRRRLSANSAGVEIAEAESPPFRALQDGELIEAASRIRASRADLLWIGLGTPKQDLVAERLRELEAAPVILCVGAAFDFLSGAKQRAPGWMQRAGLEWVHRLASEPGRLWKRYLVGNPAFLKGLLLDYIDRRRSSPRA
jgi:N-acetylglucosaminyldiphosphoundecaprenol N-acetyl-beta-D-mannosaminyltransferase